MAIVRIIMRRCMRTDKKHDVSRTGDIVDNGVYSC